MGNGDQDNWDTSKDYDVATNAAGGGTKGDTDPAYDTVGTGGEGTSVGPATHYEIGHPATDLESDAATPQASVTNFRAAMEDLERRLPTDDTSDANEVRPGSPTEISREEVPPVLLIGAGARGLRWSIALRLWVGEGAK